MTPPRIKRAVRFAVPLLTAGIFFLDWFTPLGVIDWVLYFIPLLLSFYANGRLSPILLATVFSGLTVMGYFLSPSGMEAGIALTNLILGMGTLWVVAILLARLRRSMNENRRMSAAVQQSPVPIYITDLAGHISYVNPKFTEVTGYTLDEVAGKNPRIFKSGETPPEEYKRLWEMITTGKEWRGVFHNRKKNGELYWASASIAPVFNADGKATHFVDVSEDITERKRVEDALRESELRYRSLFANMLNGYAYCEMLFEGDQPKDFIYLDVNSAFERLTGLKKVVGRKATEVIPGIREKDPELLAVYGRVARTGVAEQFEIFVQGLQMWFFISVYSPAKDHFVAVFDVITDRKKAEALLRDSEERFREMVEGAEIAVFLSQAMKFSYLNPAALRLFGAETPDQLLGQPIFSRVHPDYHEIVRKRAEKVYGGQRNAALSHEVIYLRLDGTPVPVEITASPFTYQGHRGAAVFVRDISARKRAEQAHLESEAQFRATFEQAAVGMAQGDAEGRWLRVNQRLCDIVGYSREELTQKTARDITHPDDFERGLTLLRRVLSGELETYSLEKRYIRKDKTIVPVNVTVSLVREASGQPRHLIVVVEDITERKRAEEAKGESEYKFRNLFESSQDAIMTSELPPGRFTSGNPATVKMFGAKNEAEFISHGPMDLSPERQPDGRLSAEKVREIMDIVMREGSHSFEWMHRRFGGETFLAEVHLTLITQSGKDHILGAVTDITERKRVEKALRDSEERFREIAESIQEVFWVADPAKHKVLYVSPAYEKIWGQSSQQLYDQPHAWLEAIHSDDRDRVCQAIEKQGTPGAYDEEYRIVRPDGQIRWIKDTAFPVLDIAGKVQRVVGVAHDITESRQLEEQFRQSQKMEAIGQLAGGVAHDFNNILGATMLQTEMAEMVDNLPEEARESLHEIRAYAERAANLTRQLLLFSRRQVMQPRDLDLNEVVTNLAKMLQRMIGEDVRLQLHLNSGPLLTHSDAGMLDQVLMNLAVNSRDAMPKGGRLLIETSETVVEENAVGANLNVTPGRYVCLRVSDTGCGIPPDVLPRIFDPFFTTKEEGKGTGLGLATVFGIVKQHRGWLNVSSTPGAGTTFEILLPDGIVPSSPMISAAAKPKPRGGEETILLVEDESAMRTLTSTILKRYGYKVLEACDGREALRLWQEHYGAVALLVTDLVMPKGISGQDLARQLQEERPQLKVLLMSGYSGEIADDELQLRNGENFLQKPFATDTLLQTIRRCLDE